MSTPPFAMVATHRKRRRIWPWILLALGVIVLGMVLLTVAAMGAGVKAYNDEQKAKIADVTLVSGSCKEDKELGGWKAQIRIKNNSDDNRSYMVQVNLGKGDERLGEGHVAVNDLATGATTKADVVLTTGKWQKGATCVVGTVE